MAYKTSYDLHHHFPKLAEESGFAFNIHRPRSHIDWNSIRLIDIEGLIRDRKFHLIEQHLNDILACVLESEFDVRILDEGVLKMFRLAQLAVEYHQFCRHYLDRSVYVLREEIAGLIQELDVTKKEVRERDEELRKLRKKKNTYRTPLPYGNENIANMILKSLTHKSDIFPTTSNEALQYNKCSYCDKVFLNQLYLKSHISRRHADAINIPERDNTDKKQNISSDMENSKLNLEIMELKTKLNEMETFIKTKQDAVKVPPEAKNEITVNHDINGAKKTKDAEVSTSTEDYLLVKIQEWKNEEHEKYNKEINLLRNQIVETINSFKEKELVTPAQNGSFSVEKLNTTIKQQGAEIFALKQELNNSKLKSENEEMVRKKEADAQMLILATRTEAQSKQYEALIQRLNELAIEAQESRALAEAERERAAQLQALLQQSLNSKPVENSVQASNKVANSDRKYKSDDKKKSAPKTNTNHKSNPVDDRKNLKALQSKAQELLNLRSISSSDMSSISSENEKVTHPVTSYRRAEQSNIDISHKVTKEVRNKTEIKNVQKMTNNVQRQETPKVKDREPKKYNSKSDKKLPNKMENGIIFTPGSPMKVVRAKITEEVNNRLVSAGVDPLKSRIPQSVFQKQKTIVQQQHEFKSKKNPTYQKVRNSILAYLDNTTSGASKHDQAEAQEYISPSKISKAFSLTNVISNVKSKALSFVKSNDINIKAKRKANTEVAKKAMFLLKTPPGSAHSSPLMRHSSVELKPKPVAKELKNYYSNKISRRNPEPIVEKRKYVSEEKQITTDTDDSYDDDESKKSEHNYSAITQPSTKSIESLIKSPARRPSSASANYNGPIHKFTIDRSEINLVRTQSTANVTGTKTAKVNYRIKDTNIQNNDGSSDDVASLMEIPFKKSASAESILNIQKQTKGVLKNAHSTSSLNKKKVLFDMDAIQMKSVSASPSQSITEKSDNNEKFELGLVNLDGEEWDISSIENEPLKNDTNIQVNSRTSPKIEELKKSIESQLARRNDTPSTVLVGGVDVLRGPMARAASLAGSNTSLGSSILDESDGVPTVNKAFVKPKRVTDKDESELDISEYSLDGINSKKGNESF